MSSPQERRVIEALQALTGGLTVTEHEILDARARLQGNLPDPRPGRRRTAVLAGAAAAVLVVGVVAFQTLKDEDKAAPQPATPAPAGEALEAALQAAPYDLPAAEFSAGTPLTVQTLAGLWVLRPLDSTTAPDVFNLATMYVDGNGHWRIGHPLRPLGFGTSVLAGDSWTRRMDDRARCAMNQGWAGYTRQPSTAAVAGDGSLRVQFTQDGDCTILGDREVWDAVRPGSPVMKYFQSIASEIEWKAAPGKLTEGVYVAPGTGDMLVVDADGSYRYYDNLETAPLAASDEGDLDVDSGQQTLTGTCRAGTFTGSVRVGKVPGVAGYVFPHDALKLTTAEDGCASDVARQGVWVVLDMPGTDAPYHEPRNPS